MAGTYWTPTRRQLLAGGLLLPALGGCSTTGSTAEQTPEPTNVSTPTGQPQSASPTAPTATSWGPNSDEVATAKLLIGGWTDEQLVGQVIVGRYHGDDPQIAGDMVAKLSLAGVCTTMENLTRASQVRATCAAVSKAVATTRSFPAVIGVDQEGGSVSHLRGIATTFPPFATAGAAVKQGHDDVVTAAMQALGEELRSYGYTWVFAPDADVRTSAGDPIIGNRSASKDPEIAAKAVTAAVAGFNQAGIVSTIKHFPGHGSATQDSHKVLPTITSSMTALLDKDLKPFTAGIAAAAPAVMISHLDVPAIAPGGPASLEPAMYQYLRQSMGFEGVAITDSLGMGAVMGGGDPGVRALQAGADLLLMPADTATTHAAVLAALRSGALTHERLSEAASRVVALQLFQQRRTSAATPLDPDDARRRARRAAASLVAAA